MKIVASELLERLAAEVSPAARPSPKQRSRQIGNGHAFDVQAFIDLHELDASGPKPWRAKDGTPGRRWVFKTDPMDNGHDDGSAYIVQFENGAVSAGCHHNSAKWTWADLRAKYEPGTGNAHSDRGSKPAPPPAAEPVTATVDGVELIARPLPPDGKDQPRVDLRARSDGRDVHRDSINLASSRSRCGFARAVTDTVRGVDATNVESELLKMAAEVDRLREAAAADGGDDGDSTSDAGFSKSQATRLIELTEELEVELWHDPRRDNAAFVTVRVGDHRENHQLNGRGFRTWLRRQYFDRTGKAPSSQAMQDALGVLTARATFAGPAHSTAVRVAGSADGTIWLDLADDEWRTIRVDGTGWRICDDGAPKFIRPRGVLPLPQPQKGGSIETLWKFANVAVPDQALAKAWIVGTLNPSGPYSLLALHGQQGSCKSNTSRFLRAIVDPNTTPLRAEPREVRDLVIAASNSWMCAFDNLSYLPPWLSDALCRLATGGGFACRENYADRDEVLFNEVRPVLINGISELATRADLLDRAIVLTLPQVSDTYRRTERELWAEFERVRPQILGAVLDAVATGIRNLPNVKLASVPRMADFAEWVTACEPGLDLRPGEFLPVYAGNRAMAAETILEADVVAAPVLAFASRNSPWTGTATELLSRINQTLDGDRRRQKGWPRTPAVLSNVLRRLAPALRRVGVSVEFSRSHHPRTLTIEWVPSQPSPPSPPSPSGLTPSKAVSCGDGTNPSVVPPAAAMPAPSRLGDDRQAASGTAPNGLSAVESGPEAPKNRDGDGGDDRDGRSPDRSTLPPSAEIAAERSPEPASMDEMLAHLRAIEAAGSPSAAGRRKGRKTGRKTRTNQRPGAP